MEEIMKDSRFSHIARDPRFKKNPKREQKIKIDKRFEAMFKDKKFKVNYTVDKRGRPITRTSNEDLKRYYALSSDEDEGSECEDSKEDSSDEQRKVINTAEITKNSSVKEKYSDNIHKLDNRNKIVEDNKIKIKKIENLEKCNILSKRKTRKIEQRDLEVSVENALTVNEEGEILEDRVKEKLRDLTVDYARGEGVLFSDSSSDEGSSESGSEDEELVHGWGELDHDAERTDEVTNRLAVCQMDWDRIRASDLMVLFNSFLPQGGLIHSVTIYPSEFGQKRMKEEEIKGPPELHDNRNNVEDEEKEDGEENEEGNKYHMEKLRQYQLNRLKYYYAILVCDSPATANKLYTECDGLEYESSATRLDLRFVPDNTTFDEEPREVCDKLPELSKYHPRYFTTTALQQAKVELTWDETNPERTELNQKLMSGCIDGITEADLRDYLASSSGDESNESAVEKLREIANGAEDDSLSKYRALLQGIEEKEAEKKSREVEMEVTWGVGLKDKTEELVRKKLKEKKNDLTPFEQYIEKRKDKIKQKKEEKKKKINKTDESSDNAYSDDDIPSDIDMNDPYFKEEYQGEFKKKDKKKRNNIPASKDEEIQQDKAELELLLMNDAAEKHHFSLKSIQEQEAEDKKKRKKKWKKNLTKQDIKQDEFEVNVNDERFSALFSSHHFNIDPTDSHYRKTKGMEALKAEKLHRRKNSLPTENANEVPVKIKKTDTGRSQDPELSLLVKTIKRKTQNLHKGAR